MLRIAVAAIRHAGSIPLKSPQVLRQIPQQIRSFSGITIQSNYILPVLQQPTLLQRLQPTIVPQQTRTVTKFSLGKGKRKSVHAVLKRFKRLHWGGWIRTRCGRHKKLWKKSAALKRRLRQHVFVNGHQANLLDKMVTKFWKKPKYYIDDPYAPYHTRDEYWTTKSPSKF